jgi:hypothetical protein
MYFHKWFHYIDMPSLNLENKRIWGDRRRGEQNYHNRSVTVTDHFYGGSNRVDSDRFYRPGLFNQSKHKKQTRGVEIKLHHSSFAPDVLWLGSHLEECRYR